IVAIAKEYDLFVVCDEIYINLTYNGKKAVPLADVINGVCGISMKGISKELPWPGARCGWIEVYNADKDPVFAKYIKSIVDDKMLEVCSTTLPQRVIPAIMSDSRYEGHIARRNAVYEKRSRIAYDLLKDIKGIIVNRTNGAFYLTVMFRPNVLTPDQKLVVTNAEAKRKVEQLVKDVALDKRFVYYLLGATGICVVPLTGFNCSLQGFRVTLLESDDAKFEWIFKTLGEKIAEYLQHA
ncbi:MAG: aminotransferase class I/II-fold pyridoxal phosphate-dependent enzyme, partial [Nitrospiraceae bacterium]|nr:aminotransferase class I/II-fold pyridoxal phosphate-dependent enzyme [Nitrospiraceae bacterium]